MDTAKDTTMQHVTDAVIEELRMLADDLYVSGYSRYSSAMSQAADELEHLRAENAELVDDMNLLRNNNTALRAKIAQIEQLESDLATAEQDSRQKQARIERLEKALQAMAKAYKSVPYAQWPTEMHFANEVMEESK